MSDAGWIIALWAAMVPIVAMLLLFGPPYGSLVFSLWLYYGDDMLKHWNNIDYLVAVLKYLYSQWQTDPNLTFTGFFLPVFAPIAIGIAASFYLLLRFYKYIRGVFNVS